MYNLVTQKDNMHKEYLTILGSIDSRLLRGYDLSVGLYNEAWYCIDRKESSFKSIIKAVFFKPCSICCDVKNREVLTFSSLLKRNDHDTYWEKICDDLGEHDQITVNHYKSGIQLLKDLSFFHSPINIAWLLSFYNDLRKIKPIRNRVYLACQLVERRRLLGFLARIKIHPRLVMCFFDGNPEEEFVMQYFRNKGAITVTNQHGQPVFRSYDYDRTNQGQILNFKCNYFLAKGQYTTKQFIDAGFDPKRIIELGVVGDDCSVFCDTNIKKMIGVYLDCPSFPFAKDTNEALIQIAEEVSSKLGVHYFIKIHPQDLKDKYQHFIEKGNCVNIYGNEIKLDDTFKLSDISFIHATATYLDSYRNGVRSLKLCTDVNYPIAQVSDCFSDSDEACRLISEWNNMTEAEKNNYLKNVYGKYNKWWKNGEVEKTINRLLADGNSR